MYEHKNLSRYVSAVDVALLPPHVWTIARSAYSGLIRDSRNQAVIISGESGAGKTEATKLILQFLTSASGRSAAVAAADQSGMSLEEQILMANPVLEAFGNAKTMRNNNSSRFGKLISVKFTRAGQIAGCGIITYLLEKSRVTAIHSTEQNYHIFYQLLASAGSENSVPVTSGCELEPSALRMAFLQDAHAAGTPGAAEAKDAEFLEQKGLHLRRFQECTQAMDQLRFAPEDQRSVFSAMVSAEHYHQSCHFHRTNQISACLCVCPTRRAS
jgi:hypothetical protein